jgi:hypothetical protein
LTSDIAATAAVIRAALELEMEERQSIPAWDRMLRRAYEILSDERLALLIVAALIAAIPALAHSWYPLACCGNMDCFPVACDQLVQTGSGWLYVPDRQPVPA